MSSKSMFFCQLITHVKFVDVVDVFDVVEVFEVVEVVKVNDLLPTHPSC